MSREQALEELKTLPIVERGFIDYVIKRLNLTKEQFDHIMKLPIKSHNDYETYHQYFIDNREMFKELLDKGLIPKTFYEKYTK